MNPDIIAVLRTESLAATLTAARGRRIRRRTSVIAFAAIAVAAIALSILPHRPPTSLVIAHTAPTTPIAIPPDTHIIHTPSSTVARITNRETPALIRFATEQGRRVERIDTAGLTRCFPDKGIAIIQPEGELAKAVFF